MRIIDDRSNEALFSEDCYTLPASIQGGLITLENGEAVDLLKIQATCLCAFKKTGDYVFQEAVSELSKLTGMVQDAQGQWIEAPDHG